MLRLDSWKFLLIVALPLAVATLAVSIFTFDLMSRVTTGANQADHEKTQQIVLSALNAAQQQIANMATDNSYWDDAVRQFYAKDLDEDWVAESYGVPTEDGVNYHLMLLVDRAMPEAVTGYRAGEQFRPNLSTYFKSGLLGLIAPLPSNLVDHASRGALMQTADGIAVVAAAPIVPTSEDVKVEAKEARYLVFARFLNEDVLRQIGDQYVLQDLKLLPLEEAPSGATLLQGFDGQPVAAVAWKESRPGDAAFRSVSLLAVVALGILAAVMFGIGLLCWRLFRDIGRRERTSRHAALHDNLTGLPNRAGLVQHLHAKLAEGNELALAFADLDGFKEVNDTYDHETGDTLIRAVAEGMRYLGTGDAFVARLGGDEFVAVFTGQAADTQVEKFSSNLISLLHTPFDLDGRHAAVGVSIGIAHAGTGLTVTEVMRRSDVAMYEAKRLGKNRAVVYEPAIDSARIASADIARHLKQFIGDGTMAIAYQPIVSSETGQIVAVEALARWPAGLQPTVTPDRFVAVAESSGLIDELGEAILRRACTDAAGWGELRLSVNVSPVQLRDPDFVTRVLKVLGQTGFSPERLELEVTESVVLDDFERTRRQFAALHAAGIAIALDDFGTGFSSIGYLRKLQFDRIKIDRSITSKILSSVTEQQIVQGTVLMASALTASVTAEGVEQRASIQILRLAGCRELQGFYFHKPMTAQMIGMLLSAPQTAALAG